MEHLINLIRSEFEIAQYFPLDDKGLLWKHKEYSDFWIICEIKGEFELEGLQEQIYGDLASLRKDFPECEKSMSLLILNHQEKTEDRNLKQVIDGENNVYYFKKYIIQYTTDEWTSVKDLLPAGYRNLGNMLMDSDIFEQVRNSDNSPYHLLYTVAHKLPFVMMKVERKEYNPNPVFIINQELQSVFLLEEGLPDLSGRTPSEEDIQAANDAIDSWIKAAHHE